MITAVEWLFLMLNNPNRDQEFANKILEGAKAMEKEQVIKAYKEGHYHLELDSFNPEQYYNETYKNK